MTEYRPVRAQLVRLGVVALLTVVYSVLPLGRLTPSGAAVAVVFTVALVAVVWAIARRVRTVRTTGGQVGALLTAFYAAVLLFAVTYFVVASTWPEQFRGLQTRTDALYFAVTVVTTVGFGDVHAAGQAARVLVTVQMLFNVLVLGVAVSVVRGGSRQAS